VRKIIRLAWHLALFCALAAIAAGVWFGFLFWQLSSPMCGVLAILLVLSGPALAVAIFVARPYMPDEHEPPESLLVDRIHRADTALQVVKFGRAHVGVMWSYAVVLWLCEAGGMVSLKGLLVFFTFACAVTAVGYLPWLKSRETRLYEQRAELRERLGNLESARA
jgi:hypothetical protein